VIGVSNVFQFIACYSCGGTLPVWLSGSPCRDL
jgi:hypothetical protein